MVFLGRWGGGGGGGENIEKNKKADRKKHWKM